MVVKNVVVIGAGGHGRAVAEIILQDPDMNLIGFLDDSVPKFSEVLGVTVLGSISSLEGLAQKVDGIIVAIGNNKVRSSLIKQAEALGMQLVTVIHPQAMVSPSARIGEGAAVMAGAIIGTEATLGKGAIVNSAAVVDHHCVVGAFGHLGTNACMAGGSQLGDRSWIQAGVSLGYNVFVGEEEVLMPGESRTTKT